MQDKKQLGGLDYFRIAAACLVIAIHTAPMSSFSNEADFILTGIIARVAVPFFFMVTGQFLLPASLFEKKTDRGPLFRFIRKTLILYGFATVLYIPANIYAGHWKNIGATESFRLLIFDGTFYHLWYLPALVTAACLIALLSRKLSFHSVFGIGMLLYLVGLFGDSYFGVIRNVPVISSIYEGMFSVFSYTRNGLFFAPVFLIMGAWIGHTRLLWKRNAVAAGLAVSLILMLAEGMLLHHFKLQRHDSMYLSLLPCMFFLYLFIASFRLKPNPLLRKTATWMYLIHPAVIILVRGAAKAVRLTEVLVNNSLLHFLTVCICSAMIAVLIVFMIRGTGGNHIHRGRAWIEISRENLRHNVSELKKCLSENGRLMAVVKANAYGHGAVLVSKELNIVGIKHFCVASVSEGAELRKHGIKGEILILGYTHPTDFWLLKRYRLTQTVVDAAYAGVLNQYGRAIRKKMPVHIKIDTGMHRLGERSEKTEEICNIFRCTKLKIQGIYTHLCNADSLLPVNRQLTLAQGAAFFKVLERIEERGFCCPAIHLQATDGLLNYPELSGDFARAGISLYGMMSSPADRLKCNLMLRPVLSVKARVAVVKDLYRGEAAGYGLQYVAKQDLKIAVLTIGYGDGLPRALSCGVGSVLLNGMEAPVIGRICMDQTLVDISGIPEVEQGDTAVIIGSSGNREITAYDVAERTGTITNEVLSRLGARLERLVV